MKTANTNLQQALQLPEGPEQNEKLWEIFAEVDFTDEETIKVLAEKLYF